MMTTKTSRFTGTKNPQYLNIAKISDIHLGHPRTPIEWITDNLILEFPADLETAALDVIVIAGDIFDRLIDLPNESVITVAERWIAFFLRMCAEYNIEVFIVEGTPRHDRKQSYLFEHINMLYDIGAVIVYQRRLCVYKHPRWNASFLFVPDEWHPDTNVIFEEAKRVVVESGLTQVDFAIMHGAFEYHYPPELSLPTLSSVDFQSIVKEWIFIGHIHHERIHERIMNAGSFDRLAFGEESRKGHYRVKAKGLGTVGDLVEFRENTNAMRYDTIDVTGFDVSQVVAAVTAAAPPAGGNLRLVCDKGDIASSIESSLRGEFQSFRLVVAPRKVKRVKNTTPDPLKPARPMVSVDISPDNVERLLRSRLSGGNTELDAETIERILKRVEGLVRG